jgi:hypothetical protein
VCAADHREGVRNSVAAVQHAALAELRYCGSATDLRGLVVVQPPGQVARRGEERGRTLVRVAEHSIPPALAAGTRAVRVCAARHDPLVIVVNVSVAHAERFKDMCAQVLAERLTTDALDNLGQQCIPHIGVQMLGAGLKVEFTLAPHQRHDLIARDDIIETPAGHHQEFPLVADATGVMDQVTHRNVPAEVVQFRHVNANVVIQREAALLCEQGNGKSRELLRYRRDMEHGLASDRHGILKLSQTIAPFEDDAAVVQHGDGGTGPVRPVQLREDGVDTCSMVRGRDMLSGQLRGNNSEQQKCCGTPERGTPERGTPQVAPRMVHDHGCGKVRHQSLSGGILSFAAAVRPCAQRRTRSRCHR